MSHAIAVLFDQFLSCVTPDVSSRKESLQRECADPQTIHRLSQSYTAGENLHDMFLDLLELNSVETEFTAAESPWKAALTEAIGRAFLTACKKMLESTQPIDKREFEECIDATVLARNVLLRRHRFSPCQLEFGRDPELAFGVLVPGADVAAVTMPVLDRPSERANQLCQAARQASVKCQGDKPMRRAVVPRPRAWREFQVGDQVAFWQKGMGRGMKHGLARWHGRAVILALCIGSENVWVAYRHQLLKVSQEQLRMATITERVADDVIHQELRAIGENSAAERQVLPKYLVISIDPPPPSAEEFTQATPEERARTSTGFTDGRSGVLFTAGPKVCKLAERRITSLVIQREEARTAKDSSLADQLSIVPWSAPSGEKRNLEVGEELQLKK